MADDQARRERRFQASYEALGLPLSQKEKERLRDYVDDLRELADDIATVDYPGLKGVEGVLPRQYAWVNSEAAEAANSAARSSSTLTGIGGNSVPNDIHRWSLNDVAQAIRERRVSPTDLVDKMIARIHAIDPQIHSYLTLAEKQARAYAEQLTDELNNDLCRGPLHGVVIGIKDSIPVAGMPCTGNSRLLADWIPKRDAEAARRLRESGAIIIGKHNMNEFGWSLPSEDDLAPPPRNPWFPSEHSVGSTSGGGAALAAQLCYAAIGTDGGGSVRLPAGQHSLVGIKPTHDKVPRLGYSNGSVSDIGVLARSAQDAALVLAALMQPFNGKTRTERNNWIQQQADEVTRTECLVRLGLPNDYLAQIGMEDAIKAAFDRALEICHLLDIEVVEVPATALPHLADGVKANFVIIAAEHHNVHQLTMAASCERYGASARFYNLPGSFLSASDYINAKRVGDVLRSEVDAVLQSVDMLVMPTSPVIRTSTARNPKTHRRGGNAAYTSPFNLTGHPAVSLPIGLSSEGIPIGLQLVGAYDSEFALLRVVHQIIAAHEPPPFPIP